MALFQRKHKNNRREVGAFRAFAEQIGVMRRRLTITVSHLWQSFASRDLTQADYAFWDKAWRGQAKGLEVSGLFLKPLYSRITSWVMREAPEWTLKNDTSDAGIDDLQTALNAWMSEAHTSITRAYETSLALADCYVVVNSDLSMTIVPPQVVEPIVDEDDYSQIIGWRIRERFDHPTKMGKFQVVVNEYYADVRISTVTGSDKQVSTQRFPNRIGRIPVIHVPNRASVDEMFGRSEGHALLPLLHRYGSVLDAGLQGNLKQGRPTPVIEEMVDLQTMQWFWEKYGRVEKQTLPDGTVEEEDVLDFDSDRLLTVPGRFKYAQPGPFAQETEKLLGLLFYILVQHSEMPEFAWGTAIASSKASAEEQMAPFVRFLEKKRGLAQDWLVELASVGLAYLAFIASRDIRDLKPGITWKPLTEEDAQIVLDSLKLAREEGAMDRETLLRMLPIRVKDVEAVLAAADAEAEAKQDAFDAAVDQALQDANNAANGGAEDAQDNGDPAMDEAA